MHGQIIQLIIKMAKLFPIIFVCLSLSPHLRGQTDFEANLTRTKANKIVLIGKTVTAQASRWQEIVNYDDVYAHGFVLIDRAYFAHDPAFGVSSNESEAFDAWIRRRYGLESNTAWVALDRGNKLIVFGVQVPSPKEFDERLDRAGLKSPLKIARAFLAENPDHLDAKADLLAEVRRRALHVLPPSTSRDLDAAADLRTWGILAAETDKVFAAPWLGISLRFFRPDLEQPERHSKLMRAVFRKHIAAVESAIERQPADPSLWNIWAWMARGQPDYKWGAFVNSIEPFHFKDSVCPSPDVCVWLVDEFRRKNDWQMVLKFAKAARGFISVDKGPIAGWVPGSTTKFDNSDPIKGYPAKSAYAPALEALLRLGRVDEANGLYDEMIRVEGITGRGLQNQSNNASIAASVARSLGMAELAGAWEQGLHISKAPYLATPMSNGFPGFYTSARFNSEYYKAVSQAAARLSPPLPVFTGPLTEGNLPWEQRDGKDRWVLASGDLRILGYGDSAPDPAEMQDILDRHLVKASQDNCRSYVSEHGAQPGLELYLAFELIKGNLALLGVGQSLVPSDVEQMEARWDEASARLGTVLANQPEALLDLPYIFCNLSIKNDSMKSLSPRILEWIESLLKRRPSLERLWNQWLFWRDVEDAGRPIEPLVDTIQPSPLAMPGSVPPATVLNTYFAECKSNGQWGKVIKLLKDAWDREYTRIVRYQRERQDSGASRPPQDANSKITEWYDTFLYNRYSATLGDNVGLPLMEAYLNDQKPQDADDIFNAWLGTGGAFADVSSVVELARAKGHERIAKEWEANTKGHG